MAKEWSKCTVTLDNGYVVESRFGIEEIKIGREIHYVPAPEVTTVYGNIDKSLVAWLETKGVTMTVHRDRFAESYVQTVGFDSNNIIEWLNGNVLTANPSTRGGFGMTVRGAA